jgi:hypothetical protein
LFCSGNVFSKEKERTFSLDSGYQKSANSIESIASFGYEAHSLVGYGSEVIGEKYNLTKTKTSRVLWGVFNFGLLFKLDQHFGLAFHEFGHASKDQALGLNISIKLIGESKSYDSFWSFYFGSFPRNSNGISNGVLPQKFTPSLNSREIALFQIQRKAAGVNNEVIYSEKIENEIYYGNADLSYFPIYIYNKISAGRYVSGETNGVSDDLVSLEQSYSSEGYGINRKSFKRKGLKTIFFSGTTYSFLQAGWNYYSTGKKEVTTLEVYNIKIPDFSFYLNSRGVSRKIKSGYRFKDWLFPISYEYVTNGRPGNDFSIGVQKKILEETYLLSKLLIGKGHESGNGFGYQIGIKHSIKSFNLGAIFQQYDARTLEGERLIPSLEKGYKDRQLLVGVSLKY